MSNFYAKLTINIICALCSQAQASKKKRADCRLQMVIGNRFTRDEMAALVANNQIEKILLEAKLSESQLFVFVNYYGLLGYPPVSIKSLSVDLGLTRVTVNNYRSEAEKRVRKAMGVEDRRTYSLSKRLIKELLEDYKAGSAPKSPE